MLKYWKEINRKFPPSPNKYSSLSTELCRLYVQQTYASTKCFPFKGRLSVLLWIGKNKRYTGKRNCHSFLHFLQEYKHVSSWCMLYTWRTTHLQPKLLFRKEASPTDTDLELTDKNGTSQEKQSLLTEQVGKVFWAHGVKPSTQYHQIYH